MSALGKRNLKSRGTQQDHRNRGCCVMFSAHACDRGCVGPRIGSFELRSIPESVHVWRGQWKPVHWAFVAIFCRTNEAVQYISVDARGRLRPLSRSAADPGFNEPLFRDFILLAVTASVALTLSALSPMLSVKLLHVIMYHVLSSQHLARIGGGAALCVHRAQRSTSRTRNARLTSCRSKCHTDTVSDTNVS